MVSCYSRCQIAHIVVHCLSKIPQGDVFVFFKKPLCQCVLPNTHAHTPPDPSIPMPMSERYFEEAAQDTAKSATWWSGPALRPTFGGMCLPVAAVLVVLGSLCFQLCVEKVASICAKRIPKS